MKTSRIIFPSPGALRTWRSDGEDTDDVVHVMAKVAETCKKPLYLLEPGDVKGDNKKLFFSLRLMHYLRDAIVLIRLKQREDEAKNAKDADEAAEALLGVMNTIKRELPDMDTIYLTGTMALPILDLHGENAPAVLSLEKPNVDMRHAMWQVFCNSLSV